MSRAAELRARPGSPTKFRARPTGHTCLACFLSCIYEDVVSTCAERCARLCGTWQKPRCLTSGCLPKETHRASAPTPSQNRTNLRSCRRGRGQTELRTPAERGFDSTSPNPESALFQQNLLPQGPLQPGPAFPSQRASGQAAVSQRETCASLAACWDLGTEAPSIRVREQSRQREPSPPRPFRGGLEK